MKKMGQLFYSVIALVCVLLFSACPLLNLGEDLNKFTCISADELTEYMNSLDFGTTFTLKDSKYITTSEYKVRIAYLEAADLPGKTVAAYQVYSHTGSFPWELEKAYRTTIPTVQDNRYTDYYFVKYEDELAAHFDELFSPLTQGLQKNESYRIALKPKLNTLEITKVNNQTDEILYYQTADEFIEKVYGVSVACLINKDLSDDPDYERKVNVFCYDLNHTTVHFDYGSQIKLFFTKKYPALTVTPQSLIEAGFFPNDKTVVVKQK